MYKTGRPNVFEPSDYWLAYVLKLVRISEHYTMCFLTKMKKLQTLWVSTVYNFFYASNKVSRWGYLS